MFAILIIIGCASPSPKTSALLNSEHTPIKVSSTLNCTHLVRYVKPIYPKDAKRKRIQGTVSIRFVIRETGEIEKIEVLKGAPILIPAALTAVKQWRYAPCLINSKPVAFVAGTEVS